MDQEGNKKLNQYIFLKNLGRLLSLEFILLFSSGAFGKVKLAKNEVNGGLYAIKICNKDKLKRRVYSRTKSAYTLLEHEIAIMKELNHINVVKLNEVIDGYLLRLLILKRSAIFKIIFGNGVSLKRSNYVKIILKN